MSNGKQFSGTLILTLSSSEEIGILIKSLQGGVSLDAADTVTFSVDDTTLTVAMHAPTLKQLRKMYGSYCEAADLVLETMSRLGRTTVKA
ncbi:putative Transcription factor Pcc1 [Giardia duodenalis]|uniref:Transcription factor Pcc1 n=1 Tax=Giardia intestinalis (strain ATCC 50803 / WB clone C6) TaxID=184922 RepID=A8BRL2_GIAIC|nr:putative Transcription factor Pcc1 [Giardia intestinalis]KAE8305986.1 putative Transcription factor Pcc1 [Giardia intestinalis]|eukprot:XP_001705293.1 Hypothetical protein GL50803_3679 [Giardia lamblia ATCC 50803]